MAYKTGTKGLDWLLGSNDDDDLFGYDGPDWLFGLDGDDYLSGGAGVDWLHGGAGSDNLNGGSGGDFLFGGGGDDDTVSYWGSPVGVWVSLYGNFAHYGDAEGDKLYEIENLWGSSYNDYLAGDDNYNGLWGRLGNDALVGYGGNDVLIGDSGSDVLSGGTGNDMLDGGTGPDWLHGGMGGDWLYGGNQADKFVWSSTSESDLASGMDFVVDFNRAEGDLLDLSAIDPNPSGWGNEAFTFIGTAAFSGEPGEIRYYHDSIDTFILLQTDTSPDIDGIISIAGHHTPDDSWFVL
jgi:Ca2+-binding RTX toxin-like protein